MRSLPSLFLVLVILLGGCDAIGVTDEIDSGELHIQTDYQSYELTEAGFTVQFTVDNESSTDIYFLDFLDESAKLYLEKKIDGEWIGVYFPVYTMEYPSPPPIIKAGKKATFRLDVAAPNSGNWYVVGQPSGSYRIVTPLVASWDHDDLKGKSVAKELRVTNEFKVNSLQ